MTEKSRIGKFPRLIYNSDGDSTTLLAFEPPITPEQACRDIEELVGTEVDVFSNSMGRGDETFSHPSNFAEIYGTGVTKWPEAEGLEYVRWMADNTKALLDKGINIIELLAERAHQRGMQFWPTLRMNDIHEDDTGRWEVYRSNFKREHPELLIGSPYPIRHGYGYSQDDFTWAFDFTHEEVRDRKLGLILETCEKYDIDGFELDFQRGHWYFKDGKEKEGIPLMTDFMRKIRKGTTEIMERKGKRFILMLRVPPNTGRCLDVGLDVPSWIREELGDIFVLMDGGYFDMGADIRGFVEMARGTQCRIGGGLERRSKGYGYAGNEMLYAAASSYWHQGASCIYLFNYDCHRQLYGTLPYTPAEVQILNEIHDPERIVRKNKLYCVTVDITLRTPNEGGKMPLPCELEKAGENVEFAVWVGDDIESAKQDEVLDNTWLRATFASHVAESMSVSVSLNGNRLSDGRVIEAPACTTVTFHDIPVVQGENTVSVTLDNKKSPEAVRIVGIELVINYRNGGES